MALTALPNWEDSDGSSGFIGQASSNVMNENGRFSALKKCIEGRRLPHELGLMRPCCRCPA